MVLLTLNCVKQSLAIVYLCIQENLDTKLTFSKNERLLSYQQYFQVKRCNFLSTCFSKPELTQSVSAPLQLVYSGSKHTNCKAVSHKEFRKAVLSWLAKFILIIKNSYLLPIFRVLLTLMLRYLECRKGIHS